jgi:hypothetical protein
LFEVLNTRWCILSSLRGERRGRRGEEGRERRGEERRGGERGHGERGEEGREDMVRGGRRRERTW